MLQHALSISLKKRVSLVGCLRLRWLGAEGLERDAAAHVQIKHEEETVEDGHGAKPRAHAVGRALEHKRDHLKEEEECVSSHGCETKVDVFLRSREPTRRAI